jgi:hypothetical protein
MTLENQIVPNLRFEEPFYSPSAVETHLARFITESGGMLDRAAFLRDDVAEAMNQALKTTHEEMEA